MKNSSQYVYDLKTKLSHTMGLKKLPRNIELLSRFGEKYKELFVTKPMRTMSGVAPLAIMTKPFACPTQAQCTFCPGGPDSYFGDTPKSYPGGSPAHLRGIRNHYDSYLQVFNRLEHYALLGQDFSKIELIIMGGTFTSYPLSYRDEFMTYTFKAMNDFSDLFFTDKMFNRDKFLEFFELPGDMRDVERFGRVQKKLLEMKGKTTLMEEQLRNEQSHIRCVVCCIETRSDCSRKVHIDDILRLGGTRVEIGVQTIYDHVLKRVKRGNDVRDNIVASQMLRDAYLKIGYHMMVGMPETTRAMDVDMFRVLFSDEAYKPDALKIYPCMVFKGTELYDEWKKGEFEPIDAKEAAERIVEMKKFIPSYCRVMRVQRDIPSSLVEAGVERTNLRQEIHELMKKRGLTCSCIRCREPRKTVVDFDHVKMKRFDYDASGGKEIFLSFEDVKNDVLLGFTRLRIPFHPYRKEITLDSGGIREIHVYGTAVGVGKDATRQDVQHKGFGTKLMKEAEKIAYEEFDRKKMVVISGVGVKPWFINKLGYHKDGVYVSKLLS